MIDCANALNADVFYTQQCLEDPDQGSETFRTHNLAV